jgi:hypothetical protein
VTQTLDTCFAVLNNKKESIAIISFALNTLVGLVKKIPEIKNEVLFATELHQENESPGIQHTIKNVRKELMKITQSF